MGLSVMQTENHLILLKTYIDNRVRGAAGGKKVISEEKLENGF
jgi:hypothetical protein